MGDLGNVRFWGFNERQALGVPVMPIFIGLFGGHSFPELPGEAPGNQLGAIFLGSVEDSPQGLRLTKAGETTVGG